MKPIVIIAIAVLLGGLVAVIAGNFSVQDQTSAMGETKPWLGLSCDAMLDFSASDEHQNITTDQHMEFHGYYFDNCSGTESGQP